MLAQRECPRGQTQALHRQRLVLVLLALVMYRHRLVLVLLAAPPRVVLVLIAARLHQMVANRLDISLQVAEVPTNWAVGEPSAVGAS